LSQLGVGPALVQRPELRPAHVRTGLALSVLFGLLLAAIVWLLASPIAAVLRIAELRPVLEVMALSFPVLAISVVADSLLQREMKFGRIAFAELTSEALGYGLTGIALALAGYGYWALVGAILAQSLLRTVLLLAARPHLLLPSLEARAARELIYFGAGHTGGRIGAYLAAEADNFVIGRWLGAAALGVYGRAHQLMVAPAVIFSTARDKVLFPAMAMLQSHPDRLGDAYRRGITLNAVVLLPASVVLAILTPEIVAILLGAKWSEVVLPAQILAVGILLQSGHRLSDSVVRAAGRVYRSAWRQGLSVLLVAWGAWVGQHWGIAGASLGMVAAFAVHYLVMAHLSLDLTGTTWSGFAAAHLPGLGLSALAGLAAWAAASLLRSWHLPAALVLPGTVMATGLVLLPVSFKPRCFLGADGEQVLVEVYRRLSRRRSGLPEGVPGTDVGPTGGGSLTATCDPAVCVAGAKP
jgi:O-antigen/teichoic acid export membrane protein